MSSGEQFRDYRIVEEISRGGQGVVYKAIHGPSGRGVALKLLTDSQEEAVKRFKQEGRVLSRLAHPHVLSVFEHGEQEGVPFLAIEYVDGQDLKAYVQAQGLPSAEGVARVMATVAHTIHYCHAQGVIHRDLKPANVLVEKGSGRPVVIDFGLVKRDPNEMHLASLDASVMSKSGSVKGTPEYMAPEQVDPQQFGEVSVRTDVYGLGATLYYLLTGQPPFKGGAVVVVFRKVTRKAPRDPRELNPAASATLAELCLRCLAKRPAERPESAEVLAGLLCEAGGVEMQAPAPHAQGRVQRPSSGSLPTLKASSGRNKILPARLPQPGEGFAGCTIERELGRGGAGAVYSAVRPDGARVAIKVVLGDVTSPHKRERFLREAQVGRELDHPSVVKVHERGEERGLAFLVMDLVEDARPLSGYVREEQVSVPGRVQLMLQVAEALEAAHEVELIHRDLKPDNVVVTPDGQVKVLDFGLARHLDKERLTMSGAVVGTVHYMAPEQVMGRAFEATPATDVWAMGVMLYELVKGERPFEGGTNIEVMAGIVRDEPEDPCAGVADAPDGLSEVIRMCLAKAPKDRYPSAAAFGRDLVAATSGSGSVSAQRVLAARDRQRLLARLLVVAVLLAFVGAGGFYALQRADELGEDELKERFAQLDSRAMRLLSDPGSGALQDQAAAARRLEGELAEVLGRAAGEPGATRVLRLRRRFQSLEGLAALAGGDLERARAVAEALEGEESAEASALRGGVAALGSGDTSAAVRALSRAIGRGLKRPELWAWRLHARARGGVDSPGVAEKVLEDLAVLKRLQRGALSEAQRVSEVRAQLVQGELTAAREILNTLPAAPVELRWGVALAQAAAVVEKQDEGGPARALALLQGLPAPPPAESDAPRLAQRVRGLMNPVMEGIGLATDERQERLTTLLRLCVVLQPDAPLEPRQRGGLLRCVADFNMGVPDTPTQVLARTLAEAYPRDAALQYRIAGSVIMYRKRQDLLELLPVIERAMVLSVDDGRRGVLRMLLCQTTANIAFDFFDSGIREDGERCLAAAERLEGALESPEERAWVLAMRGVGLRRLGKPGQAIDMLREALAVHDHSTFHYWLARLLSETKREPAQAFQHGANYCLSIFEARREADLLMALMWRRRAHGAGETMKRVIRHVLKHRAYHAGYWVRLAYLDLLDGDARTVADSLAQGERWFRQGRYQRDLPKLALKVTDLRRRFLAGEEVKNQLEAFVSELDALAARSPRPWWP